MGTSLEQRHAGASLDHGVGNAGVDEQGIQGHVPVELDQNDAEADEGSFVNIAVNQQDGVHVQDDGRCGRYGGGTAASGLE